MKFTSVIGGVVIMALFSAAPRMTQAADDARGKPVLKSQLQGMEKHEVRTYFGRNPDKDEVTAGPLAAIPAFKNTRTWIYNGNFWDPNDEKTIPSVFVIFDTTRSPELVVGCLFASAKSQPAAQEPKAEPKAEQQNGRVLLESDIELMTKDQIHKYFRGQPHKTFLFDNTSEIVKKGKVKVKKGSVLSWTYKGNWVDSDGNKCDRATVLIFNTGSKPFKKDDVVRALAGGCNNILLLYNYEIQPPGKFKDAIK